MNAARLAGAGELGTLRLAFSWSARFETLPALGQAFRAQRPDVALLTEEMWNARMASARHGGSIDIAVALCPEIVGELSYEPPRRDAVALIGRQHALASERAIPLAALSEEAFVLFPRELAPRLHDLFIGLFRNAGFQPKIRSESFHAGWELGVLAELPVVGIVPESVGRSLPDGSPRALQRTRVPWFEAETDADAVGFYERLGFTVARLGENFRASNASAVCALPSTDASPLQPGGRRRNSGMPTSITK
jgi:DNA-binding transcriptional LysR family regulator